MSSTQQSLSTSSIDLETALESLRAGVDTRSDENSVIHDLLDMAKAEDVPTGPFTHPKITQSIFRYEHDADVVKGEITRTLKKYGYLEADEDVDERVAEIVAVLKRAGAEANASGEGGEQA